MTLYVARTLAQPYATSTATVGRVEVDEGPHYWQVSWLRIPAGVCVCVLFCNSVTEEGFFSLWESFLIHIFASQLPTQYRRYEDGKKALDQLNGYEIAGRPMKLGSLFKFCSNSTHSHSTLHSLDIHSQPPQLLHFSTTQAVWQITSWLRAPQTSLTPMRWTR